MNDSTFSGNSASSSEGGSGGGGIYKNSGTLTVNDSTFSGNSAFFGGNSYSYGGGIYKTDGTLTVSNSTFSDNSASGIASGRGGGIYNGGLRRRPRYADRKQQQLLRQ